MRVIGSAKHAIAVQRMSLQSFSAWGASTIYIRARRNSSTVTFKIDAILYERDDDPMQRPATIGAGIWVDVVAAVT